MALNGQFGLGVTFDFVNRGMQGIIDTEKAFGNLHSSMDKKATDISGMMGKIGQAFGGLTAAVGPMLGFKSLADKAGQFELGLAKVKNVSGATSVELEQLRRVAIDAGIATQFSPTQAVEGLQSMASIGFTAKESIQALIPVLDFAAGQQLDAAEASDIAAAAMKIYGIQMDDMGFALDRLTAISNLTAIGAKDLQIALANSAKGAIAGKQGMTEMLVTMGLAKNAGLDMSVVANSVNRALLSMATTGRSTLEGLGIKVEDSKGHFRDFGDVLLDLTAKTEKMSDAQRAKTLEDALGTFGMTASLAVMEQLKNGITTQSGEIFKGAKALAYMRQQLHNSTGTMKGFRDTIQDTFEGQKTLLKGTMETIAIVLGEPLAKSFGPVVKSVTDTLNLFLKAFDSLSPETKSAVMTTLMLVTGLFSLGGAFMAGSAIMTLVMPLLSGIGVALLTLGVSLLPISPILLLMWSNWGKVTLAMKGFIDILTSGVMSSALESELEKSENQGVRSFVLAVQNGFKTVKDTVLSISSFLSDHAELIQFAATTWMIFRGSVLAWSFAGNTVKGIIWAVSNVTKIATAAQWLWNAAMNANPIGVLILLGSVLIASWTTYKTEWLYLWGEMKDGFWGVVGWIERGLKKMMNLIITAARMIPEQFQVGPLKSLAQMALYDVPEAPSEAPVATPGSPMRGRFLNEAKVRERADDQMETIFASRQGPPMPVRSGQTAREIEQAKKDDENEQIMQDLLAQQMGVPIETTINVDLDGEKVGQAVHRRTRSTSDELFMPGYEDGFGGQ